MRKFPAYLLVLLTFYSCSPKLSPDNKWGERKWVLIEMKGAPVQLSGTDRDAHLTFFAADKRYGGSGGCNRINGVYQINNKSKLIFGETASTKMLCADQAFETSFLNTLKTVDNYSIENNIMLLRKGREIVLKLR
jgi:heat shock protein HslJ